MGLQIPFDLVKPCLGQAVALVASSFVGRNHQVVVDMVFVIVMETSIDHILRTPLGQVFEGQLAQARLGMASVHALRAAGVSSPGGCTRETSRAS